MNNTTPRNAHGRTLDSLGMAIVSGHYAPGVAMPPEPSLCDSLGVSRTVVREAIKSLVAKGLVRTGPKVGTKVLPADQWNGFDADVLRWQSHAGLAREQLRDLLVLRSLIEPAAARLAAQSAQPDDLQALQTAWADMQRAVQAGGDYVGADLAFHQGLLKASGNRLLLQMSPALAVVLRMSFELGSGAEGAAVSLSRHKAVLDAVLAGAAQKAEKAALRLVDEAGAQVEAALASKRKLPSLSKPAAPLKKPKSR